MAAPVDQQQGPDHKEDDLSAAAAEGINALMEVLGAYQLRLKSAERRISDLEKELGGARAYSFSMQQKGQKYSRLAEDLQDVAWNNQQLRSKICTLNRANMRLVRLNQQLTNALNELTWGNADFYVDSSSSCSSGSNSMFDVDTAGNDE